MLINTETFQRVEDYQLRQLYPNVSFPQKLSDAALVDFPFKVLNYPEQPAIPSHQKIVDGGNEEIEGQWFIVWQIVDKSPEELYAENARVWEIQSRLMSIDSESVRPLRQVIAGVDTAAATQKLADLDAEFVALTAELAALQP